MLSLTRKADYAIAAMADLAHRGAARTSAREISKSTQVPLPVLANILYQLQHSGLVTSTMGSKGGYRLAREPEEINLADVIDAIEGPFTLAPCCVDENDDSFDGLCDLLSSCKIKGAVRRVHECLRSFLTQVSISHIAFDAVPVGLGLPGSGSVLQEESAELME